MTIDRRSFEIREQKMPEHMANLDKLTPGSLRGAREAVLEIADAVIVSARRGDDPRTGRPKFEPAVVLRFAEFPNRIYWLNTIGVNIVADEFGDEESAWVGNRIPLVVRQGVRNPNGGQADMLWVANRDEWAAIMDRDEVARASTNAVKKNTSK